MELGAVKLTLASFPNEPLTASDSQYAVLQCNVLDTAYMQATTPLDLLLNLQKSNIRYVHEVAQSLLLTFGHTLDSWPFP